ncbi:PepSY domain-containing protein [Guptibacillus algicola]|uniref:PepSY domain-containing protein n=1 Tax=Guptibacillus algicola TaxID=225844 RepID=UPI001CD37EC5|nr:PepSY domain-containing protein [Alkalihalobacillus algicola]MCA0986399.1 PepSY domain-containing protein [Alkalihalobacillus algicola]
MRDVLLGALIGAGAAMAATSLTTCKKSAIPPEKALKSVKEAVKNSYAVKGSWIHMKTDSINKFDVPFTVYSGGLTCEKEGRLEQMDFLVDANTGTIVELQKQ